jgi:hypothetical protein
MGPGQWEETDAFQLLRETCSSGGVLRCRSNVLCSMDGRRCYRRLTGRYNSEPISARYCYWTVRSAARALPAAQSAWERCWIFGRPVPRPGPLGTCHPLMDERRSKARRTPAIRYCLESPARAAYSAMPDSGRHAMSPPPAAPLQLGRRVGWRAFQTGSNHSLHSAPDAPPQRRRCALSQTALHRRAEPIRPTTPSRVDLVSPPYAAPRTAADG